MDIVTTGAAARAKAFALEKQLEESAGGVPASYFPLEHYFIPGVYARELFVPADHVIVGALHKHPQINILSHGSIAVMNGEAGVQVLYAPFTCVSPAGTKRAAVALTDCVWTTILRTDDTDPDTIVEKMTAKTEQEFVQYALSLEDKTQSDGNGQPRQNSIGETSGL